MSQLHTVIKDGHHSQYPTELVLLATDVRLVYMYMRATLCVNFAVPTIVKSKYVFSRVEQCEAGEIPAQVQQRRLTLYWSAG